MEYDNGKIQKQSSSFVPKQRKKYTIQRKREKWSDDEHKKFLEAIEKHRRNWKKVEEIVKTKSRKQIRSHAQKHFKKLEKMGAIFPAPRAKRKASHPYPSRKTSELFAIYAKQFQAQPQQLQLHSIPPVEDESIKVNKDNLNTFLGALCFPSRINASEMLIKFTEYEMLHLRVLLNNLAVVSQKDQDLLTIQHPPFYYHVVQPNYYDQSMHYDIGYDTISDPHHQYALSELPHGYHYDPSLVPHLSELHHGDLHLPVDLHQHHHHHQ